MVCRDLNCLLLVNLESHAWRICSVWQGPLPKGSYVVSFGVCYGFLVRGYNIYIYIHYPKRNYVGGSGYARGFSVEGPLLRVSMKIS